MHNNFITKSLKSNLNYQLGSMVLGENCEEFGIQSELNWYDL